MTVLPQLERDLADAATRHYGPALKRRSVIGLRFRLLRPLNVGLLLTVAVVALVVVAVRGVAPAGTGRQELEGSVASTSLASEKLASAFAVFRRERRPSDRLSALGRTDDKDWQRFLGARFVSKESRLVASNGRYRYYAVPARSRSADALCVLTLDTRGAGAGGGCGPIDEVLDVDRPRVSTTTRPG